MFANNDDSVTTISIKMSETISDQFSHIET